MVFPPGTVAVLPFDKNATIVGDAPDYAWRVNRGHVVSVIANLPPSELFPSPSDSGAEGSGRTNVCKLATSNPLEVTPVGVQVLMDDASCVQSRSCTPGTGTVIDR